MSLERQREGDGSETEGIYRRKYYKKDREKERAQRQKEYIEENVIRETERKRGIRDKRNI